MLQEFQRLKSQIKLLKDALTQEQQKVRVAAVSELRSAYWQRAVQANELVMTVAEKDKVCGQRVRPSVTR